jgi:regulator of protease activity HflC (stomatin/prohibitin superfamily)
MFAISIFIFLILTLVIIGIFTVKQQNVAIIERFGKFVRTAKPGLNYRIPFLEGIAGRVSLRVQQLDVEIESKTKDNVFVKIIVSVQYFVLPEKVYQAFYYLENPTEQIRSFVFDTVRSTVPTIILDNVFEKKDEIADAVKKELSAVMDEFGYDILKALVTDIEPDTKVKSAMNEINAAQRLRVAASEKGEADKILRVKEAEAEAESKALNGKGIADQRMAIVNGLRDSVNDFKKKIPGVQAGEVMNLVLITQYFDTLKEIGGSQNNSTILLPHSPGAIGELTDQIRQSIITGIETTKKSQKGK